MKALSLIALLALPLPAQAAVIPATSVNEFLNSIGVDSTSPDRGQPVERTVAMVKYTGVRWIRGGIEGLSAAGPTNLQTYLYLHKQTRVRFSWGLGSSGVDLPRLIDTAKPIAAAGALLAFEGNNEPNNWGVTYQGQNGGGNAKSWVAVADLQRDLYQAVKADPLLAKYPVWSISEGGAERDDVGLQFLTIPAGAGCAVPDGTKYADFANVHNYIYHPNSPDPVDNKTWNAADPTSATKVDGLFGNYGSTWAKHFRGYSEDQLTKLPRVTTETGSTISPEVSEQFQGMNLLSMYLDQFKRGWSYTAVYLLHDRADEGGNQKFGFYKPDYTPRRAAFYLHNLTTILADSGTATQMGSLDYSIENQTPTVHDMLLQKSDGTLELIIWNERLQGANEVTIHWKGGGSDVQIFDPTIGIDPIQPPSRPGTQELTLSDHPMIVAISGAKP